MNVVIIGGGTAGSTVAFYLRKLNKDVNITIVENSKFTQFSPCSLPYYITNEISDLFVFKEQDYKSANIDLRLNTDVSSIDKKNKVVHTSAGNINYDKLVLATGTKNFIPDGFNGLTLKNPDDIFLIDKKCKKGKSIGIIGGGFIGVEMAYVLKQRGCEVSLFEATEQILPNLDKDMSEYIKSYLESNGVSVYVGSIPKQKENAISVNNQSHTFDEIIISTGFVPNLDAAKELGLKIDKGIVVDDYLSADKDVYACGDCVVVKDFVLGNKIQAYFATHAVNQAEIVSENILGAKKKFHPVLNANISNIGIYFGSVGISSKTAEKNGIKVISAKSKGTTKSDHHKHSKEIVAKIIVDSKGTLLGGQIIGGEDISGRINLLSLAIKKKNTIYDLAELETCYNPASTPIFDVIVKAARMCIRRMG